MTSPSSVAPVFRDGSEVPLVPETDTDYTVNRTVPYGLRKTSPSFHLLIPASQTNGKFCKTLLSSFVLSYPSPTLINYGKVFDGSNHEEGAHTGKIRGIFDFLNNEKNVKDDDLVLIIDGYDVWFQLPPKIVIERYHLAVGEANERLRGRYGTILHKNPQKSGGTETVSKYTQKVIFGADKLCWPNPAEDPACAAVPYSTLPKNVYGPETDQDSEGLLNRPRYLNSGVVIGPVADVRSIYEIAVKRVDEGRGGSGDQFVLGEIFGEQEYQREILRRSSQGTGGKWIEWLSDALGTSESPLSANITIKNMTAKPGQNYEFGIGIDYESKLFQTMTHSEGDMEYVTYNDSRLLSHIQGNHPSLWSRPFSLPTDLQRANPPYSYASPGNHSEDPKDVNLLPFSSKLDDIAQEPSWYEVPLATNIKAGTVPTLLHFNGDKSLLSTWWPLMWYFPKSRALLRRYIRSVHGPNAAYAAARGGLNWWDTRGGRGGVWTDKGGWMNWSEVCKNTEDDVFVDGKGLWENHEGSDRVLNSFGTVIYDEDPKR